MPPDQEVFEVEQRLAMRRAQLAQQSRETTARAMQALASPLALAAAAAVGFIAAGAVARRKHRPPYPERRKSDHVKAAKRKGLVGMLLPAAMWLVRAQWGSPAQAAQALLGKFNNRNSQKAAASSRGDMTRS